MRRIFGTDGARGIANKELTVELALRIGRAAGLKFKDRAPILIGEDTRISSPMLRNATSAGVASAGVDVVQSGVIPTPAVSLLTHLNDFAAGIMVSASHNPVEYNGIKLFDRFGYKLTDEAEEEVEQFMKNTEGLPEGANVGTINLQDNLREQYITHLLKRFSMNLKGIKIAVDTAFGATYYTTPETLERLGAKLFLYGNTPDGKRINVNCGSTNIDTIQRLTKETNADVGIAHDGDGDRVLAVDEKGIPLDGDEMMLIIAKYLKKRNKLLGNKVVGTVMSNMGVEKAFNSAGITFLRAKVGDRYVLQKMQENNAVIGGEQSGHIILLEESHTGDGLITALYLLKVMKEENAPLSELRKGVVHFPQILLNVQVEDKKILNDPKVQDFIGKEKKKLSGRGRIVVRASGTEPLIRIMVEGENKKETLRVAEKIKNFLEEVRQCVG